MSIVSVKDLLHAGVHFGHQQRFWNPKMEKFIFDTRKQISIINLDMTQEHLSAAASKVEDICSKGKEEKFKVILLKKVLGSIHAWRDTIY